MLQNAGAKTVQRWMLKAELETTQNTGLLRGGRDGTHYVTDAANADPLRARERLALPQTPEVRVTLEVPNGIFPSHHELSQRLICLEAVWNVPPRAMFLSEFWGCINVCRTPYRTGRNSACQRLYSHGFDCAHHICQ